MRKGSAATPKWQWPYGAETTPRHTERHPLAVWQDDAKTQERHRDTLKQGMRLLQNKNPRCKDALLFVKLIRKI